MKSKTKRIIISYAVTILVGALLVWLYIGLRDYEGAALKERYKMIADALTIPGLLFVMFGLLVWASFQGAMDGLGYAFRNLISALIPGMRIQKQEGYKEYLEARREKRRESRGYGFLFFSGLLFMGLASIFVILYYRV